MDIQNNIDTINPKSIKSVYNHCAKAVIFYLVLSYGISFLLAFLRNNFLPYNDNILFYQILSLIVTILLNVIPFYICNKKISGLLEKEEKKPLEWNLIIGAMGFVFALNFSFGLIVQQIQKLLNNVNVELTSPNFSLSNNLSENIVLFLLMVIVAPITEEYMFRGVFFKGFRKFGGNNFAIIITALFFSIIHGNLIQAIPAFFIAIVFGYVRSKSSSILPCVILHMINNGYSFISILVLSILNKLGLTINNSNIMTNNLSDFQFINVLIIAIINILLFTFLISCFIIVIVVLIKKVIQIDRNTLLNKTYSYKFVFLCVWFDIALIVIVLRMFLSIKLF